MASIFTKSSVLDIWQVSEYTSGNIQGGSFALRSSVLISGETKYETLKIEPNSLCST